MTCNDTCVWSCARIAPTSLISFVLPFFLASAPVCCARSGGARFRFHVLSRSA